MDRLWQYLAYDTLAHFSYLSSPIWTAYTRCKGFGITLVQSLASLIFAILKSMLVSSRNEPLQRIFNAQSASDLSTSLIYSHSYFTFQVTLFAIFMLMIMTFLQALLRHCIRITRLFLAMILRPLHQLCVSLRE